MTPTVSPSGVRCATTFPSSRRATSSTAPAYHSCGSGCHVPSLTHIPHLRVSRDPYPRPLPPPLACRGAHARPIENCKWLHAEPSALSVPALRTQSRSRVIMSCVTTLLHG